MHFSTANGEVFTLNCGQSSFAYVPPSGFFGWGGVTPFRLTTTVTPGQAGYLYGRVRAAKPGTSYYIDPQIELSAAAGGTVNIATAYKSSRYTYEGTETTETSIVRTGGTADPTAQVQSRKIVTTANALWVRPFKAEPYAAWNATTGANVTATIYGVVNGSLPLNDEIWAEFECVSEIVAVVGDSNWFNVKLLMGFEGADAATGGPGMTDEGSSARGAATVVGNAQIDTAQFKLGTSSLLLDGSGDYLTFPDSADWDFGAGQFTIEGFFRFAATPTNTILLAQWSGGWAFWFSGGVLGFRPASGGDTNGYTFSPTLNQWYHIAIDRDASNVARIYVDGVMQSKTTTYTANITGSSSVLAVGSLTPGGFNTYDLNGWIDEVRISAGVARYASDAGFAVPTAPFPRVAGVTGGTFVGKIVSTTKANLLAAGTAVAPDISVWSGAAIPAWAPFKLTATLTPGLAGYIHARVRVGKASATYYIDPQVYLT